MDTDAIKKLIETHDKKLNSGEIKQDFYKNNLDLLSKLMSLILSALGIGLGVFAVFKLNSLTDGQEYIYIYGLGIGAVFFALFIIFFALLSSRILNNVSSNYIKLKCTLEAFDCIYQEVTEKNKEIGEQTNILKQASANIARSPFSNLISWYQSSLLEIGANKVFAISSDLSWVVGERLDKILKDLKENESDKYFYILISKSPTAESNYNDIETRIHNEIARGEIKELEKRFQIKKLCDLVMNGNKIFNDYNYLLPIPNDVVVYKDIKNSKTVVISTSTINKNYTEADLHNNFDVKFYDAEQVNRILIWFETTWKLLTNEDIKNE